MDHSVIEVRVVAHHNLWIPSHCDEDSVHAAPNWRQQDLADLQADNEGESHNHCREIPTTVVCRVGELQVQVGEQRTEVGNEDGAHGQHRADEAVLNKSVHSTVLHHRPGVLRRWYIGLSV